MSKQCCDIKNLDVLNEKVPENIIMPNRVYNNGVSENSAYDSQCKTCATSGSASCNQKYNYRKYRLSRPMKHYRLSYTNNSGVQKTSGKPTIAAFERPGGVITNGKCNGSACKNSESSNSEGSISSGLLFHTKSAINNKRSSVSETSTCCDGCDSAVCAGQVVLGNNKTCDCIDYSGSKTTGRHVTRSANTRVSVRKGISNRERLRQRGMTFAQNQNRRPIPFDSNNSLFNQGYGNTYNAELCNCDKMKEGSVFTGSNGPLTTQKPSNSKLLTSNNPSNKGLYTQGAVDAGTRMEKLKLETFNKVNKKQGDANDNYRNILYRGDYKSNQNSKKFSIEKSFNLVSRDKKCCD